MNINSIQLLFFVNHTMRSFGMYLLYAGEIYGLQDVARIATEEYISWFKKELQAPGSTERLAKYAEAWPKGSEPHYFLSCMPKIAVAVIQTYREERDNFVRSHPQENVERLDRMASAWTDIVLDETVQPGVLAELTAECNQFADLVKAGNSQAEALRIARGE